MGKKERGKSDRKNVSKEKEQSKSDILVNRVLSQISHPQIPHESLEPWSEQFFSLFLFIYLIDALWGQHIYMYKGRFYVSFEIKWGFLWSNKARIFFMEWSGFFNSLKFQFLPEDFSNFDLVNEDLYRRLKKFLYKKNHVVTVVEKTTAPTIPMRFFQIFSYVTFF